jgi:hypothetical protein
VILVNVERHHGIHRHAEQGRVCERDHEYSPNSEWSQQMQDPRGVSRENVSNSFQRKFSLREKPLRIHTAETIRRVRLPNLLYRR